MPALDGLIGLAAPGSREWVVREGDNIARDFTVKINGVAVNFTGCTGVCSIRADYAAITDLVTAAVTFPTPTAGTVRLTLTAANTTALAGLIVAGTSGLQLLASVGVYDVELQDGTNQVTILTGGVTVSREVTP